MSELEFCIGNKTLAFEFLERTHFKVDPYDGHTWMKYVSVITYGFGLIGSGFLGIVIWYESSSRRIAPYRTVTNQLVSWTLFELILYITFILGIDVLRMWIGPLSPELCLMSNFVKSFLFVTFAIIIAILTIMKFVFLCIIKGIPEFDDDKVTRMILVGVSSFGGIICGIKYGMNTKPTINECICMGTYDEDWAKLDKRLPLDLAFGAQAILIHNILTYPVYKERKRVENQEQQQENINEPQAGEGNMPKSLEHFLANWLILALLLIGVYSLGAMNKLKPQDLSEFPNHWCVFFNIVFCPFLCILTATILLMKKHGKDILTSVGQASPQNVVPTEAQPDKFVNIVVPTIKIN